jgi:hypothetical protein
MTFLFEKIKVMLTAANHLRISSLVHESGSTHFLVEIETWIAMKYLPPVGSASLGNISPWPQIVHAATAVTMPVNA